MLPGGTEELSKLGKDSLTHLCTPCSPSVLETVPEAGAPGSVYFPPEVPSPAASAAPGNGLKMHILGP